MRGEKFSKPSDLFQPTSKIIDGEKLSGIEGVGLLIIIPKVVVEALGLRAGDHLEWIDYDSETGIIRLRK